MKTLGDLKNLYDITLLRDLEILERERKGIANKLIYIGFGISGVSILIIAIFFNSVHDKWALFMFPGFIGNVIFLGIYRFVTKDYIKKYKAKIIQMIVSFFDENLTYNASSYIPQSQFVGCRIFNHHPDRYKGDDLVRGKLGATEIEFSEIHAEYKAEGNRNSRAQWYTIFEGLFFVADFNKHFKGKTIVLPDTAERSFWHIGKMFQSWITQGELIKLEDIEFEKLFAVYGDDQVEARYILSTSLMKRIVDFKKKYNRPIHLSFVESKIYVAISYTKSLFEPRVFKTILDFAPIQEYFEDLTLAIGLVEDLNLNTRIWSKQ